MRRSSAFVVLVAALALGGTAVRTVPGFASFVDDKDKKDVKRPSLSVKASPMVSFAPARITLTAELKGGPNDYEEFYCPTVEWDWGDDTRSESTADCQPYETGKSEIRRRFTTQHVYRLSGEYRIQILLKKKDKAVGAAYVNVQVRPGLQEPPVDLQ